MSILSVIRYEDRDSTEFRNYWLYMPQFRVLDQNDFATTMAVFLMLFIFIALICFAAVIVISFTRCMTIALTNAKVYDDLRHLGAPKSYLFRSVKGQVSKVFFVPAIVGTTLISAFYAMIMYFNDNRFTRKSVCRKLGIGYRSIFKPFAKRALYFEKIYRYSANFSFLMIRQKSPHT